MGLCFFLAGFLKVARIIVLRQHFSLRRAPRSGRVQRCEGWWGNQRGNWWHISHGGRGTLIQTQQRSSMEEIFQKTHFHKARVETPQGVVRCSPMCIHDRTCYPRKEKKDVSPLFSCQKPALNVPLLCTPWQSSLTEPKEEVQDSERQDMKWFKGRSSTKLSLSSSFRHSSEAAVDGSKDEVQRGCERWQWLVPIGTNSLKDNLWLKIPLIPGCPTFWRGGLHWKKLRAGVLQWDWWHFIERNFQWQTIPRHIEEIQMEVSSSLALSKSRDHSIDVQWLSIYYVFHLRFQGFPPWYTGRNYQSFLSVHSISLSGFRATRRFSWKDVLSYQMIAECSRCRRLFRQAAAM